MTQRVNEPEWSREDTATPPPGEWLLRDSGLALPRHLEGLVAVRAVVHLPGRPLQSLMREGGSGHYGFLGGTIDCSRSAEQALERELRQEAGLRNISSPQFVSVFDTPGRYGSCSKEKWEAWGFSSEGLQEHGGDVLVQISFSSPEPKIRLSKKQWRSLGEPPAERRPNGEFEVRLALLPAKPLWLPREALEAAVGPLGAVAVRTRGVKLYVPTPQTILYAAETSQLPKKDYFEGHRVRPVDLARELEVIKPSHRQFAEFWLQLCKRQGAVGPEKD